MSESNPVCDLATGRCKPCEGGVAALTGEEVAALLKHLVGWGVEGGRIAKTYTFKDHYQALAFVNAVAWISHRENHHPDMSVGFNSCRVAYITHAIDGLSENDFICAAKIDKLFAL